MNTKNMTNGGMIRKTSKGNRTRRLSKEGETIGDLPESSFGKRFFVKSQSHSKNGKLIKSDRKPMGSCNKKFNISMSERKKNMNSIMSDVRVSNKASDSTAKGAAPPPPVGERRKYGLPGYLQRRKRDSEKISRDENRKYYYMMR